MARRCDALPAELTGGVLGGDRLETRVELGAGSRVCLSTPSATRVYRSAGLPAVQRVTFHVGDGAALEYLPDHVIPSPGSRLIQSVLLDLAPGAVAILCDAWAAGRAARGEAWRFICSTPAPRRAIARVCFSRTA
jgi:urease accessory protein